VIRPDDWKPAGGLVLEPNAFSAATEQVRSLALTAGPGAGKTEMLAQRADFLLQTGVSPYPKRILAISFKVDASKNLKARVQKRCGSEMAARLDSYTFHGFAKRIIDIFRPVLTGLDTLDPDYTVGDVRVDKKQITFADMIPMAVEILSNCAVARQALHQAYSDVFLDEFQDCTDGQYKLVKLAFLGSEIRMIAVGDTKQRIMSWAGALEGVFAEYAEDFTATSLNLFRNFRSKGKLLRLQNEIIKTLDPPSVMSEELIPDNDGSIQIVNFPSCAQEAEYVAQTISHWIENGVPISEIAVLVRVQVGPYTEKIVDHLNALDIPCRNEQDLQELASEPLTEFISDFLLVLFGEKEPDAWTRLNDSFNIISHSSGAQDEPLFFSDFLNDTFLKIREDSDLFAPFEAKWELVNTLIQQIGPSRLPLLSIDYENPQRVADLIEQTKAAIEDAIELTPDIVSAIKRLDEVHAVRLLTIHKSKGLEFEAVILLGIENEAYFGNPNESLCTYFVGVSRAKNDLVLTCCDYRERPTEEVKRWNSNRTEQKKYMDFVRCVAD